MSESILELGTKQHPYKSIKAVFVELLNFHSNQDKSIFIYINGNQSYYIQDGTNFIMNITNVTINAYSDQSDIMTRPMLIPTVIPQSAQSKRTVFSILNDTNLKLDKVIAEGGYTESEILSLSDSLVTFFIVRSSICIDSINFERGVFNYEIEAKLFHIIYLQDKMMQISNSMINVTGTLALSSEPLNGHFENITIDTYGLQEGFDFAISCNYPEANLRSNINFDSLKAVTSSERSHFKSPHLLRYSGPGNISCSNLDLTELYSTLSDPTAVLFYFRGVY